MTSALVLLMVPLLVLDVVGNGNVSETHFGLPLNLESITAKPYLIRKLSIWLLSGDHLCDSRLLKVFMMGHQEVLEKLLSVWILLSNPRVYVKLVQCLVHNLVILRILALPN